MYKLLYGDCLDKLKELPDNSLDSLVTDPPAGISFMGKDWDGDKGGSKQWIAWMTEVMQECLRVLKPGAHGLVWAIPRTSHWTATALEDAGFEIRDVVTHIFGSGFPKSLDISKAIDKAAGAEREVVGLKSDTVSQYRSPTIGGFRGGNYNNIDDSTYDLRKQEEFNKITAPATPEAKQWQGWGTALKPASEHWILVRKPCSERTVAANVLKHGTGGLNIDASRIPVTLDDPNHRGDRGLGRSSGGHKSQYVGGDTNNQIKEYHQHSGRFPANLVLSHNPDCEDKCTEGCAVSMLDEQGAAQGAGRSNGNKTNDKSGHQDAYVGGELVNKIQGPCYSDKRSVSRFFYCAKASKADKNAGLEGMPEVECGIGDDRPSGQSMSRLDGRPPRKSQNTHPTVKSTKLMSYLIKLITPPSGVVLDPFTGSGSTGVAALVEGFAFIGIEREQEYYDIAEARLANAYGVL